MLATESRLRLRGPEDGTQGDESLACIREPAFANEGQTAVVTPLPVGVRARLRLRLERLPVLEAEPEFHTLAHLPPAESVEGEGHGLLAVASAAPWRGAEATLRQHEEFNPRCGAAAG